MLDFVLSIAQTLSSGIGVIGTFLVDQLFYLSSAVAIISTIMAVSRRQPVHALLYLVVSLLAVAVIFFSLSAPFAAALEIVVYAGAIMVLFIFVIMMLNVAPEKAGRDHPLMVKQHWFGPALLALILFIQLGSVFLQGDQAFGAIGAEVAQRVSASQDTLKGLSITLFGPYLLGVEIASFLLLAGLVGAYHVGQRETKKYQEK